MAKPLQIDSGTLLAAWPDLQDPNFMHSVLVMCQHSDEGAYGLVVNRPSPFTLRDLFPEHEILGQSPFPVHVGGPVEPQAFQFLHRVPERIPGGIPLDGRLWLGGELEAMAVYLEQEPVAAGDHLRALLGYSGWQAGQLDAELRTGSWLPATMDPSAVFGGVGEEVWRKVLRSVGKEGADLGSLPPDVSWN